MRLSWETPARNIVVDSAAEFRPSVRAENACAAMTQ